MKSDCLSTQGNKIGCKHVRKLNESNECDQNNKFVSCKAKTIDCLYYDALRESATTGVLCGFITNSSIYEHKFIMKIIGFEHISHKNTKVYKSTLVNYFSFRF